VTRSPVAALTVLLASLSLGACYIGPDPVQYAALAVVDDVLYEWSVTVTLPNLVPYAEVELLGAPRPNWQITSEARTVGEGVGSFKVVPLTSIEPGRHYTLDSSDGGPEGSSAPAVTFTTDDFTRIEAGQVLAPTDHKHSEVVSRDSFVNARCH
jgi:hypothetical protein